MTCWSALTPEPGRGRPGICRKALLLACALLLGGCEQGEPPAARSEMAVQGLFTAALSEDARLSLVGSLNHGGSLWRNAGHERLYNWNHEAGTFTDLAAAAFSPDGSRALTASPRTLVVWDTGSGAALSFWGAPAEVMSAALASGGEQVLLGLADHSALIIDARDGAHRGTLLHEGPVSQARLSTDGQWIFTGSDDETAVLWRRADLTAIQRLQADNPVRQVAVSHTGRYLFTASHHGQVSLWEGATGRVLSTLYRTNPGVTAARFSANEERLLLGFVNARVELWDVVRGERLQRWHAVGRQRLRRGGNAILDVAFSTAAGPYLALGSDGYLLELR